MASIIYREDFIFDYQLCSGIVFKDDLILTSTRCIFDLYEVEQKKVVVMTGTVDALIAAVKCGVAEFGLTSAPGIQPPVQVGFIKLAKKLNLGSSTKTLDPLPPPLGPAKGNAQLIGWGDTLRTSSRWLRSIDVNIMNRSFCAKSCSGCNNQTVCALSLSEGKPTLGDSGGALVVERKGDKWLAGIYQLFDSGVLYFIDSSLISRLFKGVNP